jgi:hypothetical protein
MIGVPTRVWPGTIVERLSSRGDLLGNPRDRRPVCGRIEALGRDSLFEHADDNDDPCGEGPLLLLQGLHERRQSKRCGNQHDQDDSPHRPDSDPSRDLVVEAQPEGISVMEPDDQNHGDDQGAHHEPRVRPQPAGGADHERHGRGRQSTQVHIRVIQKCGCGSEQHHKQDRSQSDVPPSVHPVVRDQCRRRSHQADSNQQHIQREHLQAKEAKGDPRRHLTFRATSRPDQFERAEYHRAEYQNLQVDVRERDQHQERQHGCQSKGALWWAIELTEKARQAVISNSSRHQRDRLARQQRGGEPH